MLSGLPSSRRPRAGSLSLPGPRAPQPRTTLSLPAPPAENPLLPPSALHHAVLAGARIREGIQISVSIKEHATRAAVKYSWIILIEKGTYRHRTEVTTETVIRNDATLAAQIEDLALEKVLVKSSGHDGSRVIPETSKSIDRATAKLDLRIFNAYVEKVKAFRNSPENKDHVLLPAHQARDLNADLSAATAAGMVPIAISGALGASAKTIAPTAVWKGRVYMRWSLPRLSRFLGKTLTSGDVSGWATKLGGGLGVPKSMEAGQAKWGGEFIDPTSRPLVVYTDFKDRGQSIYGHDVSPEWVKQGYHWLYLVTIVPLRKAFGLTK
ncbi:MAG TPA: hypothetical protein VF690_21775 [Hymenobacter sp.]|jgi:hypothetical protein